jgi:hypothetical protein
MQRFGEQAIPRRKGTEAISRLDCGDEHAALFIGCKARRLSWNAKFFLEDLRPLEADIDNVTAAVVQVYKTIADSR